VALYYMLANAASLRVVFGLVSEHTLWFGIQPLLAGVFGVPAGFAVAIAVSLTRLRRRPKVAAQPGSMPG